MQSGAALQPALQPGTLGGVDVERCGGGTTVGDVGAIDVPPGGCFSGKYDVNLRRADTFVTYLEVDLRIGKDCQHGEQYKRKGTFEHWGFFG